MDIESGTYRLDYGRVFFTPTKVSCKDDDLSPNDAMFMVYDDGSLVLSDGETATAEFIKAPKSSADPNGGIAVYGCWDGNEFTPNA